LCFEKRPSGRFFAYRQPAHPPVPVSAKALANTIHSLHTTDGKANAEPQSTAAH